jgi:tryptophan 2,3-dioxygenase
MSRTPTTYWDYIKVESLLALQSGKGTDDGGLSNDEVLFITVHQIDELWFKLIVRELAAVRDLFSQTPVPEQSLASAARGIRRIATLWGSVAQHFSLMETMTTRDYLAFRDKLYPASGFQSAQLREIEILMGLGDTERIAFSSDSSYLDALRKPDGTPSDSYHRVAARLQEKSVRAALRGWLFRTPIEGSTPDDADDEAVVSRFIENYVGALQTELDNTSTMARELAKHEADRERLERRYRDEIDNARAFLTASDLPEDQRREVSRIRAALVFIESYRELPLLAWPREILDGVVALEQSFLVFRQRHARMVERVIGRRTGTGGSAGVDYLDSTALKYRVFRDVWAVRTLLLRRDALPQLAHADYYDFAGGH